MSQAVLRRALPLLLVLGWLGCTGNPSSLWINFSIFETNLVLIDHEPPPF